MKTRIAGKAKAETTRLLLQTRGVQSVSMNLSSGAILPPDTSRIALSWLAYPVSSWQRGGATQATLPERRSVADEFDKEKSSMKRGTENA